MYINIRASWPLRENNDSSKDVPVQYYYSCTVVTKRRIVRVIAIQIVEIK